MILQDKNERLSTFLSNIKSFKHGEGLLQIIEFMKDNKLVTVKNMSILLNRHVDTIWNHLNKGMERGLIEKHDNYWPYRFSLTKRGEINDK